MDKVTSADGTPIAFDRIGDGPPVVVVAPALCDRSDTYALAEHLARHHTVINYDRRGRGDSGNTRPYAVLREVEDIAALITAAGGAASVYGHSSGAALALHAAAHGCAIIKLVVHEPPYGPDDADHRAAARDIAEKIEAALAEDRRGEAVELFLAGAGMPSAMVEQSSRDPRTRAMAPTLGHEFQIMGNVHSGGTVPADLVRAVRVPTLVINGGHSPAWMIDSGRRIARHLPAGSHRVLPGQHHMVPPEALVPVLTEFLDE
ncbi:alpha/beta hydrolase [Spongiactinospora rosea]|uniref:Alpha/beta hydrolase n=1 Tax=Spongiactinospora rosea TaxID=2248750 RepID=A0A366LWK5_9ACTN|nr:alpha/beta hydrolase [Spongiactinospora rosea]RBQ18336.1 alpha/beta hydrolase [Spongiactinospora rosea]